jgi:hypothetical protein
MIKPMPDGTVCPGVKPHRKKRSMTRKGKAKPQETKEPVVKNVSPELPSSLSDADTRELRDWRGKTLARVRALITQADPDAVEELKWKKPSNPSGVPVWSHEGIICTGETYRDKVKLTFARGAVLEDPSSLFNSSLNGKARRAIDIREGDKIDEAAFITLVRAAVAVNTSGSGSEG